MTESKEDITINMNDKSKVKNLCNWQISWKRITQSGDEVLKPNATVYITNSEIESQVLNGNKYIGGTDRQGSHAKVYIENAELREYLEFDNYKEKKVQFILNDDECKRILELKTDSAFKKNLEENVKNDSEKAMIANYAKKTKFNDYNKIKILSEFTNIDF